MHDDLSPLERRAVRLLAAYPVGGRGLVNLARITAELQITPDQMRAMLANKRFSQSVDQERVRLAELEAETTK